ncbi:hypothetical protein QP938_09880 [Porticoccaceae bacterium LTM1]|nr:hypothetical protein QP938_09880 [Porticoccaceae bacterium LTM1]
MNTLLDQVESSVETGSYLLGLYVALALPDICGALESNNGRATGNRYKAWFNKWVAPKYERILTGDQCYAYRCGVLHQGRSKHESLGYSKIIFLEPNPNIYMHKNIFNDALNLDLKEFCSDIVSSVREWLLTMNENGNYKRNYEHFMRRHEKGLAPYVVGVPVIG